jgi:hypothetical protein
VFSSASKDRFCVRKADLTNTVFIVNALQLLSKALTIILALASDQGKRIKLAAPITILEKACAQKLNIMLMVLRLNTKKVIC